VTRPPRWLGAIVPLLLIAVWELAARRGDAPEYLPAPSVILAELGALAAGGDLFVHAGASLYRALGAFAIGAATGAAVGLAAGTLRAVERFYEPIISLTYPVPKIAALPIVFAWFGLGDASKIVIITISVFYPIYIAAFFGAKGTSRVHVWAARNMGAGRWQIFRHVVLPSALPQLFNGLRVGLALSFIVMVVAELVASQRGLGYLIAFSEEQTRFDIMYAAIFTIGVLGFGADRLLLAVRRRALKGQLLATAEAR
jgi:ABC-type nitrate/sulfonate/bicarbonate transport system permease component